jgi:hypothetical protein
MATEDGKAMPCVTLPKNLLAALRDLGGWDSEILALKLS